MGRGYFLGFVDSGPTEPPAEGCFAAIALEEAAVRLATLIREFRPHVVITYDETGGYPHPDHIRTHEVTIAAFDAAGDPGRFPEAGQPRQPAKLYYHGALSRAWFPDDARRDDRPRPGLRHAGPGPARARHPDRPGWRFHAARQER
ncbi:PIG-L family deacetylase [Nonomuraea indica]|uniref:PIG-L family deacetylase n=1 Tax=Nonomuraea indica TaxID=1581193 RepID=UPI001FE48379|nr:PIG-L family deacetylase [Nonomuraea indica]